MTRSFVAHSIASSALQAGEEIGEAISAGFNGEAPDALVVFASSRHDYAALLGRIQDIARPAAMIGCSSAGEFTSHAFQAGAVSAVALRSDTMRFNPVLGRGLRQDRHKAAQAMAAFPSACLSVSARIDRCVGGTCGRLCGAADFAYRGFLSAVWRRSGGRR
jgi:hypothetical protein